MGEFQKAPSKFSFSLSETRDSIGSLNGGEDEEFYEKIEAPKFVDFSQPDRCSTDDRYWFCLRMGCDRKHEEEMDPEEIYNNFVLRVMAARSPNVRLRKALNSSRTPTKCPLSAPPKSSKPRLSRMALISPFSKKMAEEKKKVARPLGSTPLTKTKPVSAKYLTTPRNKKCTSDRSLFASVQLQKPVSGEVPTSRAVAKALVFGSPKKANNVKTSSTTPISKLCQGMNRLEIASEGKHVLGYSSKSSKSLGNSRKVVKEKPKSLQTCKGQEAKSGRLIRTKNRGQSQQQDSKRLLGSDDCKKPPATKDTEESRIQESSNEEHKHSTQNPDLASADVSEKEVKGRNDSSSEATKAEEINLKPQPTSRDDNGNENFTSESCVASADQFKPSNSVEGEQSGKDFDDEDDKENAAASVENRMPNNTLKQTPRKIFGMQDKSDQVRKKVTQAQDNLKEMKVTKPKATNPKPFRLRTDERGVLKESTLDKRADPLDSENASMSIPGGKLQKKHVNDIQKVNTIGVLKTPKGQERSKSASTTLESNKHQEPKKTSNAMQRLERFRKLASPLPKHHARPQGLVSRKKEMISYLIPGQKLDVIPESSPEVSQPRSIQKPTRNDPPTDDAASNSSSHGRRLIAVASEPKFHSTNIPKSCAKKLK